MILRGQYTVCMSRYRGAEMCGCVWSGFVLIRRVPGMACELI